MGLSFGISLLSPINFKETSAAISDEPTLVGNIVDNNDWNITPKSGEWKLDKSSANEFNIQHVQMRTHGSSDFRIIDYSNNSWRKDIGWNELKRGTNQPGFIASGVDNNIHITMSSYYNLYLHYSETDGSRKIDLYYDQSATTELECQIWLDGSKLTSTDAIALGFDFDFTYDDSLTSKYSLLDSETKRITVHNYKDMYVTNWTTPAGYSFSDYQIGYTDNTTAQTTKNVHVKQWATEVKQNGNWNTAVNYINMYFTTNINTVTLDKQNGSSGTSTIYEKLSKGFYLDTSCSQKMTTSAYNVTTPTRTGYTFLGYWTNTGGGGTQIINSTGYIMNNSASFATSTGNTTLYANWSAKTFNISYALNGGTHGTNHPSSGTYDTAFAVSAPTKTGYIFAGWTVTSGLNSSTAKWGTTSSPAIAISSTSTKCVNGTSDVYFKNINAASDAVTFTANWDAHEEDSTDSSQQNYEIAEATGVRYEAEEAALTNADIKLLSGEGSYAYGVSGEGFVGFSGGTVSKISFSVSTKTKGLYQLYIKYSVGMDGSGVKVTCNGNSETINYPYNNGWGSFNITPPILTSVRLNSGENTIELSKSGAEKYGEIDYIDIGECIEVDIAPNLPHGTSWTKFEAEDGEVVSATRKSGTASGSKYVGNIDNEYSYIDFNFSLEETGSYEIKIKYATGFSDRPITVYAGERGRDGRLEFYASLSTTVTSWGNFVHTASCFAGLKKNSFIRIYSRYVEIDYLELSNKVGDFFNGVTNEIAPDEDITDGGFSKLG